MLPNTGSNPGERLFSHFQTLIPKQKGNQALGFGLGFGLGAGAGVQVGVEIQ